ncbi:hypothetical protein F3K43_05100 [Streptomyces sp. LBUM 1476]|nr:hypothetical protein [Streptomyces sp. LBUM 1476]
MTDPAATAALFDVPTPVEQLLLLAAEFTRHNDMLDIRAPHHATVPLADTLGASAVRLSAATRAAISTVQEQRLPANAELAAVLTRLTQLAHLSSGSVGQDHHVARALTTWAPEAAVDCAEVLAAETRRRTGTAIAARQLTSGEHTALTDIARGHACADNSLGRDRTRSRENRVPVSALRTLESQGLVHRVPRTVPPAYPGGPHWDRIHLTPAGITALAPVLGLSPASPSTNRSRTRLAPRHLSPPALPRTC